MSDAPTSRSNNNSSSSSSNAAAHAAKKAAAAAAVAAIKGATQGHTKNEKVKPGAAPAVEDTSALPDAIVLPKTLRRLIVKREKVCC
jgi:hypothetical protein